ncbi:MAG: hypothetical protein QM820_21350 [Minicystis sp.]
MSLKLHAFAGKDPPPDFESDFGRLSRLPPEALAKFWQVLGPCVAEPMTKETERLLDVFRSAYRISDEDLGRALKASRFLILSAAQQDLPAEKLAEDLDQICQDLPVIRELLLLGYEPIKGPLREGFKKAALLDHGNVLVGAQWRLDLVDSTEQGLRLQLPVAMLTLHYQHGTETGRITLQVLPDMMMQLKAICERVLAT